MLTNIFLKDVFDRLFVSQLLGRLSFGRLGQSLKDDIKKAVPNIITYSFFRQIKTLGFVFRANSQSCVAFGDPRTPKLASLIAICKKKNTKKVLLIVRSLQTSVIEHLGLVQVQDTDLIFTLKLSELVIMRPLNIYQLQNCSQQTCFYVSNFFWFFRFFLRQITLLKNETWTLVKISKCYKKNVCSLNFW